MKLTLTREEMLVRRRRAGGFEPLRTDCTVEDTAGVDVDAVLEQELRSRYVEMLDTADPALLVTDDVAGATVLMPYADGGSVLEPPEECRRVLAVRLEGWNRGAKVLAESELARVAALQRNPFTSSDADEPLAVVLADGRVAAWPGGAKAAEVTAVCDPGPNVYRIDERAVGLLCESKYNLT